MSMKNHLGHHGNLTRVLFICTTVLIFSIGTANISLAGVVADFVLLGGKIVTMDPNNSMAQAVAVKWGKIIAVGTNEEIRPLIGEKTVVVDVKGRTVVP